MRTRFAALAAACAFVLLASHTPAALPIPTTNPAGTLHASDVVEVTVYDLNGPGTATPFVVRLDEKGQIKLPLLDEIPIGEITNDAAAAVVSKAYKKAQVMNHAVVTVAIAYTAQQMPVKPGPLAAGDTLQVTVMELTGPGRPTVLDAAVAPDGTVTLPLVGKVSVAGQSDADASRAIAKAYRDGQLINNPMIVLLRTASGS